SVFFAIALALATSAAMRVMRRISSSVTIGLLANPHTPLWITRTPNPAAPRPAPRRLPAPPPRPNPPPRPPPNPPPSALRSGPPFALTLLLTLRVNRMSAYVQPIRFASPSAMSDRPLNVEVIGLPFGDCAINSPTRSLEAMRMPVAPVYFRKSRRDGLIALHRRRNGRHVEIFDANRRHQRRARAVVRFAGVNRLRFADRRDVRERDERRHVPAEVLHRTGDLAVLDQEQAVACHARLQQRQRIDRTQVPEEGHEQSAPRRLDHVIERLIRPFDDEAHVRVRGRGRDLLATRGRGI